SNRIKQVRLEKKITIQALADKAQVSKGLISQIENNRTVPSLWVLMSIIVALNLDFNEFFKDISQQKKNPHPVIFKKQHDYQVFEKENSTGFLYHRAFTRNMQGGPVDFVLLELKKGAKRNRMVKTDSFEFNYMIKGAVEYFIDDKRYLFEEGDSLFLDSRLNHKLSNIGKGDALMLVVYFFITNNQ
ncbi:MAG: helix-turn-helix transcriptional regulator, partial [Bacteroidetes bacterium]|nr:helix-turn-helix transcriptional regulator [Bacteroidota bacterium]